MRYVVTRRLLTGPSAGLEVETETDVEFEAGREYRCGWGVVLTRYLVIEVRDRWNPEALADLPPEQQRGRLLVLEARERQRRRREAFLDSLPAEARDEAIAKDEAIAEGERLVEVHRWAIEDRHRGFRFLEEPAD